MRTRDYKSKLEEYEDQYQEARDEEFRQQFQFELMYKMSETYGGVWIFETPITEDDIQGFIDSFTFPDIDQWCADQYESERDAYADAKYQEFKEKDI